MMIIATRVEIHWIRLNNCKYTQLNKLQEQKIDTTICVTSLQFVSTSFPNRFSCEFHITQDDGDNEDDYSDEEFDAEDANEEDLNASTLMSVHLDTFLEKRYECILVPLFVCLCECLHSKYL